MTCLCHDVSAEECVPYAAVMFDYFSCLVLSQCPICRVEDPDAERWDRTDTFMSQHMLITFRSLSDRATRAGTGEAANWMIPTSEPQVGFYDINRKLFRNCAQVLAQAFIQLHPFSIFLYLLPGCCDSDPCTSWYLLLQVPMIQDFNVFCSNACTENMLTRTQASIKKSSCLGGDITADQ